MSDYVEKFPIYLIERQTLTLTQGCELLSVGMQYGSPCLWARVEPTAPPRKVAIFIVQTGQELPKVGLAYLGTLVGEVHAYHVFEEFTHGE